MHKQTVEINVEFEVEFDSDGEPDKVYLNGENLTDIFNSTMLYHLRAQALADHIADLKDRGIKYKGGA